MKGAMTLIAATVAVALGACGGDSDEQSAPPAGGQPTSGQGGEKPTFTSGRPTVERKLFWRGSGGYRCSKPIEGRMRPGYQVNGGSYAPRRLWRELRDGDLEQVPKKWRRARPARVFVPSDRAEAQKFCRASIVIEYRSVLAILQKPWVERLIASHSPRAAWVRALHHDYIRDEDYLARILSAFEAARVDCVIVVHSPERDVFFVEYAPEHEGHADHRYVRLSERAFRASLAAAPAADRAAFWDNLR